MILLMSRNDVVLAMVSIFFIFLIVAPRNNDEPQNIKETVDYKNIVNQNDRSVAKQFDESEIPLLI